MHNAFLLRDKAANVGEMSSLEYVYSVAVEG
jgi:hypothetical protein